MGFFSKDGNVLSQIDAQAMEDHKRAEQELQKALTTGGYGTDAATYINGHALIPEDLESTIINVVEKTKDDCKIFNSLKKTPVKSTVHQYNRRTETGDFKHLSVAEGAGSPETNQAIERAFVNMKYLQTRRSVTKQMELTDGFENAIASEKLCGVETITKGVEYMLIHGDSSVVPTEFDGFLATLKKAKNTTIKDWRGDSIGKKGEEAFDDVARDVWDRNGDLDKVMFPSVLAKDVKGLFADRLRFTPIDTNGSFKQMPDYTTAIGSTLRFTGNNAGADKFFQVKGPVKEEGSVTLRPKAPSAFTASVAGEGSQFTGAFATGDYFYTVHAVNAYGISPAKALSGAATIASAGQQITLNITPDTSGPIPTGYIICRSAKGGKSAADCMEMVQIAANNESAVTYIDNNDDLPGTASMILLPKQGIMNDYDLAQLLPCSTYPLYPKDAPETPFLVMFYGALEVKAPEHCALIKNVSYSGGLY